MKSLSQMRPPLCWRLSGSTSRTILGQTKQAAGVSRLATFGYLSGESPSDLSFSVAMDVPVSLPSAPSVSSVSCAKSRITPVVPSRA